MDAARVMDLMIALCAVNMEDDVSTDEMIKDVHTEHCCSRHGCKYGKEDTCTVCTGKVPQSYPCEYCAEEEEFEQSRWHPIETRPDEGEFLAYDPVSGKQDVCCATLQRWKDGLRKSCTAVQQDGEYGPDEDEFQGGRATHWQRLLAAPK